MNLSEELRNVLSAEGAELIGYGTLTDEICPDYPVGVSVALSVPLHILNDLEDGPTKAYYDMYYEWNERLNQIVRAGEQFLTHNGYQALALTTDAVTIDKEWKSRLPHKTVATRSGLGWIGKNGLLVTSEFGPAVRISSILTDAPLAVHSRWINLYAVRAAYAGRTVRLRQSKVYFGIQRCRESRSWM